MRSGVVAAILVVASLFAGGAHAQNALPDPSRTLAAVNPAVTQGTIGETICVQGWTRIVRPPAEYTEELKRRQIRVFGYRDRRLGHYEEDHLLSGVATAKLSANAAVRRASTSAVCRL